MAQYKVLQDIEAEDKLLGPLSLRQFIYAIIVVALGFVAWQLLMVQWLLVLPFIPPIIFFALLAAPFGRDQSSEVWLLAKIKYFIFPRRRLWDQEGIQEMVTVTAPKVEPKPALKDFDKDEAKSRLKALAATMDTRGWAVRNVQTPGYYNQYNNQGSSDRLLELQTYPPEEVAAVKPTEDVLDTHNPLAEAMGSMVAQNNQAHRQAMLQNLHQLAAKQHTVTDNLASIPATKATVPVAAPTSPAPAAKPAPIPTSTATPVAPAAQTAVTQNPAPAILNEVKSPPSPDTLHVKKAAKESGDDANEVVVSLH